MVDRFLRSMAIPCPMQVSGAPVVTVGGVISCHVPLVRLGLALEGRARTVAAPRAEAMTRAFCRRFSMRVSFGPREFSKASCTKIDGAWPTHFALFK